MTRYTVFSSDEYKRFSSYEDARAHANALEAQGVGVSIVQTVRGSDWTIYKSASIGAEVA